MTRITNITIENIKGIDQKILNFEDMYHNRLHILVARNGFGKSSLSTMFDSLLKTRLDIDKDDLHSNNRSSRLQLTLRTKNKEIITMSATESFSNFSGVMNVHVFKNPQISTATIMGGGHIKFAKARTKVKSIVLYDTIPAKKKINYDICDNSIINGYNKLFSKYKKFMENNIEYILLNRDKLQRVYKLSGLRKVVESILDEIDISKTVSFILESFDFERVNNKIFDVKMNELLILIEDIEDFKVNKSFELESYLFIIYASEILRCNEGDLIGIKKYNDYIAFRKELDEVIEMYNTTGRKLSSKVEKGSLVVNFLDANRMSYGERDLLSFLVGLYKVRRQLTEKRTILIIDELFDYLDGTNLLVAQYHLSELIKYSDFNKFSLFPMILTHLDPNVFQSYRLPKMKVHYLDSKAIKPNKDILNLIIRRSNGSLQNKSFKECVEKYYLHYHPTNYEAKDSIFGEIYSNKSFRTSQSFRTMVYQELDKYINTERKEKYCLLSVSCGIRLMVENILFNLIEEKDREKFLETHKTLEKINF